MIIIPRKAEVLAHIPDERFKVEPNQCRKQSHSKFERKIGMIEVHLFMEQTLYCCGLAHICKVYNLPFKGNKRWKRLYFLDECPFCGQTVASLQECDNNGMLRILARRTGREAIKLRDKLTKFGLIYNTQSGTLSNEIVLFNNRGIIYNLNNRRVGTNEEFIQRACI